VINISKIFAASADVKTQISKDDAIIKAIQDGFELLRSTAFVSEGTIFAAGNGGSACDAMHFVEELVARYKATRPGIKAMHFADPGMVTCWSNDYEYNGVFERYADTFCSPSDTLVAISTSGNSENILRAIKSAKSKGSKVIGLTGQSGGKMVGLCDVLIKVPSSETARIQEAHITIIHTWCELLDGKL
jgi:D-sedoheptulose 7-phosphate isomerase